jgi:hypothetical protein
MNAFLFSMELRYTWNRNIVKYQYLCIDWIYTHKWNKDIILWLYLYWHVSFLLFDIITTGWFPPQIILTAMVTGITEILLKVTLTTINLSHTLRWKRNCKHLNKENK